ncbi:hypothetical protein PAXRUDRAFT_282222 [Paxillus rubicundulus Ve08.2h10]|uniref:Uncharacterized protein n=1 Tax=Paxillus rubicundulus Ve08.2h10 TaxID=930991 RepID=A0A0D0E5R4_9AGAM|nr:hypothetical protein PAXRUDRAFT_282222 [Paxillus rubicundulus Ve08.2h10]
MMLMGFVKTRVQRLRIDLPHRLTGTPNCLTMWYPKYMYQCRLTLFYGAAGSANNARYHSLLLRFLPGCSGAFSGLLAYANDHMDGGGGLEGWSRILVGSCCD